MHLPHEQVVDESLMISSPTRITTTPTQEDKQEGKVGSNDGNGIRSTKDTAISKGRSIGVGSSQKDPSFRSGGISVIGSWALGSCSDLAGAELNMSSKSRMEEVQIGRGDDEEGALTSVSSFIGYMGDYIPWGGFVTGAQFQVRLNGLLAAFLILLVASVYYGQLFHNQIQGLEKEKSELRGEVAFLSSRMDILIQRMEDVVALIPLKSSNRASRDSEEQDGQRENGQDKLKIGQFQERVKRSPDAVTGPEPSRSTTNLQYSLNSLNNGTDSFNSMLDPSWSGVTPTSSTLSKGPRAAYLQIDASSVHIKKSRQLIGPWYLPNSDTEIMDVGFGQNHLWYDQLVLSSNATSVVFQEDGLFLIYAQVFYQLQQVQNIKPAPMGYRIHLKRSRINQEGRKSRNPVVIAECVPSFPTTVYQTCYTQVVWSVQAQDEIYLEHFTESRPIIEAISNGQTFLGIVRLSH